jgi:hypothetical protein
MAASANPLDEEACQRLRTERQALTVLGIDKHFEKGALWAKERLTVADLNLVKRYLDVYEQIKFRCEKIVALVEPEEKDEDDDDDKGAGAAGSPPMPERKAGQPVKALMTPAAPPQIKSNTVTKTVKAPAANASSLGPARTLPER